MFYVRINYYKISKRVKIIITEQKSKNKIYRYNHFRLIPVLYLGYNKNNDLTVKFGMNISKVLG